KSHAALMIGSEAGPFPARSCRSSGGSFMSDTAGRTRRGSRAPRIAAVFLGAAVLAWLAVALPASAARATTAPGFEYHIPVTLTASSIKIDKDRFTLPNGVQPYPRGALIYFEFKNTSRRALGAKLVYAGGHECSSI